MNNNLSLVKVGGATPRIFDILSTTQTEEHFAPSKRKLFDHDILNNCFIIKHAPRSHEERFLSKETHIATKIVFPIDRSDLTCGGHSIFIEEHDFKRKLSNFLGVRESQISKRDWELISILGEAPSFDPFLMHESLLSFDRTIHPEYFKVTDHELFRLRSYVSDRIRPLVSMATGQTNSTTKEQADRFVSTIMSDEASDNNKRALLQAALKINLENFNRGMFGWKGILYYDWQMSQLAIKINHFINEFSTLNIIGARSEDQKEIKKIQGFIVKKLIDRYKSLEKSMNEYDRNYDVFLRTKNPDQLRVFLLSAPDMFNNIGCRISAITHITSYWVFHSKNHGKNMDVSAAFDLLRNFSASLMNTYDEFP